VVSFTSRPLYPQRKSPWHPLDRSLGGLQSRSEHGGEEKNSQPPTGIEPQNPVRPTRSAALYRLSNHGSDQNVGTHFLFIPCALHATPASFFSIESGEKKIYEHFHWIRNRDSSVVERWATDWMIGGSSPGSGWEFFSSPSWPDRLWEPISLLSNWYQVSFLGSKAVEA
jgi:hypothetical protein